MTKKLSAARAKDREVMATQLEHVVKQHNATVERDELMTREREIWLHIQAPRGLAVTITLDGDSKQDREGVFCMPWHIDTRHDTRLSEAFGYAMGSRVNQFHRAKCTVFGYGFDELCALLDHALTMADDGRAFEAIAP